MPSFDWITQQWSFLSDAADNSKKVGSHEFLRRSGVEQSSDWLSLAQDWGRKQSPAITVEYRKDVSVVILRKRA
jgi:hypothetical protein